MMGLKEAIHTCGGKVMPVFNFSTANDSNFFYLSFHTDESKIVLPDTFIID